MYVPVTISNICKFSRLFKEAAKLTPVSSPAYMNWSSVIIGATIIFPGMYWIYGARHKYLRGSNSVLEDNVVIVNGEADSLGEF